MVWFSPEKEKNLSENLLGPPKSLVHLRKAPINAEMNIPTPHFLLREPKCKKPTLISCHIRFNNDRIIFSVGERILPAEWDSSKQRAINQEPVDLQIQYNELEGKLNDIINALPERQREVYLLHKVEGLKY